MNTMKLDKTLTYVVSQAKKQLSPRCVLLYGSRARGDARERSDYDIAVDCPVLDEQAWAKFVLSLQENAPTLHHIDVVCLQQISKSLYDEIEKTGVVLYRAESGKQNP